MSSGSRRKSPPARQDGKAPGAAAPVGAGAHAAHAVPTFPVVGIGASAGGLEALERFLANVPENCGMAFVVIQHLDPTRKGILPELLQRVTKMPVRQVRERTTVKPDRVYVIPPNRDLSIEQGILHLVAPAEPRGLRLPIDCFLRSLADDRGVLAVGVILSGMGRDGTRGLAAIRDKGGLALVQDPAGARFAGMPQSARDAGMADIVAPAEALPGRIADCLARVRQPPDLAVRAPAEGTPGSLAEVIRLLHVRTGNDFSLYKRGALNRRIERRMVVHKIDRIGRYARYLHDNPREVDLLFKELLIGVTSFFRDPHVWDRFSQLALPTLLNEQPAGEPLRAWVAGCSTGEEAYSLAIALREARDRLGPHGGQPPQIFATDLDQAAVDRARTGVFSANMAADVSPERLERFFLSEGGHYRANREIREQVVFAVQNLVKDPPFTRLDILCCRNLLIYLAPELQKKLVPLFHYCLNPGGVLLLGSAETLSGFGHLFTPLDARARIYRSVAAGRLAAPVHFPSAFLATALTIPERGTMTTPPANMESLVEQLILRHHSPAAVLANEQGDLLYTSTRTGRYLEPPVGKANLNLFAMAREGLRHELAAAFKEATRRRSEVLVRGLEVGTNGGMARVDLTVRPLLQPEALRGTVLVIFTEVATVPRRRRAKTGELLPAAASRVTELEAEVLLLEEALRSTREEMQSSHEELRSANEELQSTNEELTTSKEELQSLNEELQTVNAELQSKVDELSRASSDMANLLDSTEVGTVFLDLKLKVRRFTEKAARVFRLLPGDIGRPLSDLVTDLAYPNMSSDAQVVLRTLVFSEKKVRTRDGREFRVRLMPYRTLENVIDGLVITFIDVTSEQDAAVERKKAARSPAGARGQGRSTTRK